MVRERLAREHRRELHHARAGLGRGVPARAEAYRLVAWLLHRPLLSAVCAAPGGAERLRGVLCDTYHSTQAGSTDGRDESAGTRSSTAIGSGRSGDIAISASTIRRQSALAAAASA